MHNNKIYAGVTTWPQEQFFLPMQILAQDTFLKQTSQKFSSVSPEEKIPFFFNIDSQRGSLQVTTSDANAIFCG